MGEVSVVVGTVQGITEKPSGWTSVEILVPGKNYPVRLDTKRTEVIDQVRAVGAQTATFSYTEVESDKINEKSGRPYINRYLEAVELGATEAAQEVSNRSTAGGSQSHYTEEEVARFEAKERRDFRSRAWAQTISAFQHTIKVDEDPEQVFLRLQPFQRKLYEDVCQSFAYASDQSDIPF